MSRKLAMAVLHEWLLLLLCVVVATALKPSHPAPLPTTQGSVEVSAGAEVSGPADSSSILRTEKDKRRRSSGQQYVEVSPVADVDVLPTASIIRSQASKSQRKRDAKQRSQVELEPQRNRKILKAWLQWDNMTTLEVSPHRTRPSLLEEGAPYDSLQAELSVPTDERYSESYCGGKEIVRTCGFKHGPAICLNTVEGSKECWRGLCLCTSQRGCLNPICRGPNDQPPYECKADDTMCADGESCITMPGGEGWECWHPCNMAHHPLAYGLENMQIVMDIRATRACEKFLEHTTNKAQTWWRDTKQVEQERLESADGYSYASNAFASSTTQELSTSSLEPLVRLDADGDTVVTFEPGQPLGIYVPDFDVGQISKIAKDTQAWHRGVQAGWVMKYVDDGIEGPVFYSQAILKKAIQGDRRFYVTFRTDKAFNETETQEANAEASDSNTGVQFAEPKVPLVVQKQADSAGLASHKIWPTPSPTVAKPTPEVPMDADINLVDQGILPGSKHSSKDGPTTTEKDLLEDDDDWFR